MELSHLCAGQYDKSLCFMRNLARTRRNSLATAIQWTSIQIFLCTLWTRKKAGNSRRAAQQDGHKNMCSNCGVVEENTKHLMVNCPVAEAIWRALALAINECLDHVHRPGIDIQAENVLFNNDYQIPQDSGVDREQISEAIMIAKHTILKIKYREGNTAPSVRLAIMAKEKCYNECETLKGIHHNMSTQVGCNV